MHIINWNYKYVVVADLINSAFKIFDIELGEVISIYKHNDSLVSVKKIFHPIYGESLLSAARDEKIRLWSIKFIIKYRINFNYRNYFLIL